MATNLVRYELDGAPHWGVASASGIAPLDGAYPTTAALIEHGEADWRRASARAPSVSFDSALILSPVTTPCRIYCQGANYRQHMIESGMDPDAKAFNMFFTKSDASVASAKGTVTPPKHVSLLDYEIELALIFRRPIVSAATVTRETAQGLCLRRRHRKRPQRPRRAAAANAILQGQELSRLLPDRPVADRARTRRIRLPRRPRARCSRSTTRSGSGIRRRISCSSRPRRFPNCPPSPISRPATCC